MQDKIAAAKEAFGKLLEEQLKRPMFIAELFKIVKHC